MISSRSKIRRRIRPRRDTGIRNDGQFVPARQFGQNGFGFRDERRAVLQNSLLHFGLNLDQIGRGDGDV